jgi:hypothetical protein
MIDHVEEAKINRSLFLGFFGLPAGQSKEFDQVVQGSQPIHSPFLI